MYHAHGADLILLALACAQAPAPPRATATCPSPTVSVEGDWRVVHERADSVAIGKHGTADGARLTLGPAPEGVDGVERVPGVSPVSRGRTFDVTHDGLRWPLVASAYPDKPLTRCAVRGAGPDLVMQLDGPPLNTLTPHLKAPEDPAITWVRMRPRGDAWRIVIDGLATISLPGGVVVRPGEGADAYVVAHDAWGSATLATGARAWRTEARPARWWLVTGPALERQDPYPRTTLTWTPVSP